ncbi:MAG: hypothetical protein IT462_08295 [Planctomycetes bacterium]|nr:hypothetical protein [Planctomycetota bacterium]
MDPRIEHPQQPATPDADRALQLDLRLYARLESATILLQSFVSAGRIILEDREKERLAPLTEKEQAATGEKRMDEGVHATQESAHATQESAHATQGNTANIKPHRPYRPRVNATPMLVLAHRAAKALPESARLCHALGRELLARGVDLESAVYKRRINDYVLQFLHQCGVDISDMPRNDAATLRRALDRIDDVIAEGVKLVNKLPSHVELVRRRMLEQRAISPRGP